VVEQKAPGGQAGESSSIENYLGFPSGLSGGELAHRAVTQARRLGAEILSPRKAVGLVSDGPSKTIKLEDGSELLCRSLLIATGVSYRKLEAIGVEVLTGAGIYYGAAMSEGESVKDQDIAIIGGANSAGQAAMYFSRFAKTITLIVRGESISNSMSKYLIDQIDATPNIKIFTKTKVLEAIGSDRLKALKLKHEDDQRIEDIPASAIFIFIGALPHTLSGPDINAKVQTKTAFSQHRSPFMLETSTQGVFVAGDVRHGSIKRVASAVGEGSMAVMYVHRYLSTV
jgi:thioredoxin reductase (NADPH)